jgi:hypothetical protein
MKKGPLRLYKVVYEFRTCGAIGNWGTLTEEVFARTEKEACETVINRYEGRYEFRNPKEVTILK